MQKQAFQKFLLFSKKLIQEFENNKIFEKKINQNLGIIYTPNKIVDYIVSNILKIYFEELVNYKNFAQKGFNLDDLKHLMSKNQNLKKLVVERIKNIKILDPACGSGRFLLSIADKLYEIYKIISPENKDYDLRREIIEKHLYGIEIEKSAYLISKLKLILWLFSKNINSFNYDELSIVKLKIENLDKIIDGFNIKFNIYNLDFLLEFYTNQFDLIIGNPPYIENKKLRNSHYKNQLTKKFKTAYRLFDVSVVFMEKSLDLLKQNIGFLSFLTTNKFLSADYGLKIRELLINKTTLKEIINISSLSVFKKISAYPIIISFLKKKPSNNNKISIKTFDSLNDLINNNFSYSKVLPQFAVRDLPTKTIPISGEINLLNYLYDNFIPMAQVIDDLKIIYRPFGFLNYSKYYDNASEKRESDEDLLLIGTGNVGKYHIKFDNHIRIAKKDLKISYFKFTSNFKNIWELLKREKLIFREIARELTWVYDPGLYTNITGLYCLIIPSYSTEQLFNLLTIMNSNAIDQSFKSLFSSLHMSGGYLRFNGSFIRRLPLPKEFPLSVSYLGKIIQTLSQLQYELNSTNLKLLNNSKLNQFKKKNYSEIKNNLKFYIRLANSLINLLYFKDIYLNSNINFELLNEILYRKNYVPKIQFKYILPRFNLPQYKVYQNEELNSTFSKINNFYKVLNQNDKLLNQMKNICYKNLNLKKIK